MERTTTIIHPFYMSETEWYDAMNNISIRAKEMAELISKIDRSSATKAIVSFSFAYDSYTTWNSSKGINWLEFLVFGEFTSAYEEYNTLQDWLLGIDKLPTGYSWLSKKIEDLSGKIKERNPKKDDLESEEYIWTLWKGDLAKEIISKEFNRTFEESPTRCVGLYTERILEEILNGILHRLEMRELFKD